MLEQTLHFQPRPLELGLQRRRTVVDRVERLDGAVDGRGLHFLVALVVICPRCFRRFIRGRGRWLGGAASQVGAHAAGLRI